MSRFTDGLKNVLNSLSNLRNSTTNNKATHTRVSNSELNAIFKTGLGRKIISLKVGAALKNGLIFDSDDDRKYYEKNLSDKVSEACKYMLGFGRGIIVIIEKDKLLSDELSPAIDMDNMRLEVFDGTQVSVGQVSIDLMDDRYMKPSSYMVRGNDIHHSRVIDFTYVKPTENDLASYMYGGISETELIYQQIINDEIVSRAGATILEKNSTIFYKVKGFKDALRAKKDNEIINFFSALENARSIFGAGIVDADDTIESVSQTLADFEKVDTSTLRRLAMVTSIPMAYLIGENVKGLNSSGSIEKDAFENMKESLQDEYIITKLNELLTKLGLGVGSFDRSLSLSPTEKVEYEGKAIDNAKKLYDIGEDYSKYLKEHNIKVKDDGANFNEED